MNAMLINVFANLILGSGVFEQIKSVVKEESENMTSGSEKRANVAGKLQLIGIAAGTSLINLGIELAVNWLKAKSK